MAEQTVVLDARAGQIVDAIRVAARSGRIGESKIFVSSIEEAVRGRNDDHGEAAL